MTSMIVVLYFVIGIIVSGAFVRRLHNRVYRSERDHGLLSFIFFFGVFIWPAILFVATLFGICTSLERPFRRFVLGEK